MTLTRRKQQSRDQAADPNVVPTATALESGMRYNCDTCSADITHSVRVKCAEATAEKLTCPDFDLCVPCFLAGHSLGPHKAHHAYRIISSHSFPIFAPDWGADEELLLVEGAEMYGLGNWADMAEYVGARTKEECEQHYQAIYLRSPTYPLPDTAVQLNISQDTFQARKKRRLEHVQAQPLILPPPKPMASAPTCHEIAGFMPGRLEYETEYENEAESLVKDMEFGKVYLFGGDEQPAAVEEPVVEKPGVKDEAGEEVKEPKVLEENEGELQLKLAVLDMFNERYDRRMAAKEVIFDRGLMNYKTILANERKRTKEDRDLVTRTKVFARVQTAQDHEVFTDGLLYELALRRRITELQEYRRVGLTTLTDSERYDREKGQRIQTKQAGFRDSAALSYDRNVARTYRPTLAAPSSNTSSNRQSLSPRPTTSILTLATSSSLHLLTTLEKQLCSTLRMLPRPYLFLKEALIREWVRRGSRMTVQDAKEVVGIRGPGGNDGMGRGTSGDWGEKVERVWEFLKESGGLRRAPEPVVVLEEVAPVEAEGPNGAAGGMEVEMTPAPGVM